MPRPKKDPIDKALYAYAALTIQEQDEFMRILSIIHQHLRAKQPPRPRKPKPPASASTPPPSTSGGTK
jgi:hypothetical protein